MSFRFIVEVRAVKQATETSRSDRSWLAVGFNPRKEMAGRIASRSDRSRKRAGPYSGAKCCPLKAKEAQDDVFGWVLSGRYATPACQLSNTVG